MFSDRLTLMSQKKQKKKRNSIAAIRYLRVPFNSSGTLIYRKMKPTLTRLFIMVRQSLHILQQGCFHSPHTLLTSLSLSVSFFLLLLLLSPLRLKCNNSNVGGLSSVINISVLLGDIVFLRLLSL